MGRFLLGLLLLPTAPALAHPLDDSKIAIAVEGSRLDIRWEISLRDLDAMVDLDRDGNGRISTEEHAAKRSEIEAYARPHLKIEAEGEACAPSGTATQTFEPRGDNAYVTLRYALACAKPPGRLAIGFDLFAKDHIPPRALVSVVAGEKSWSAALADDRRTLAVDLGAPGRVGFLSFFVSGVTHMLEGIDHLLFLGVLLLPLLFGEKQDLPMRRFVEAARILTAFTLAHGLTLWLAALGIVAVPARLVESVIALSIAATALDNVVPFLGRRRWLVALGFGLVHGLGFASALGPLSLPPVELALSLLAFNLGLETAQLGVALLVLPLGFLASTRRPARRALLPLGSAAAGLVAMLWFAERAFDVAVFS